MTNKETGLILVTETNGKQVVNARDLHAFLGSKQRFSDWIKNRIEQYDLIEGEDYEKLHFDYKGNLLIIRDHKKVKSENQHVSKTEYALSINAAKELSMVEGNEKGKRARRYFIACEAKLIETGKHHLPMNYLDALKSLVVAEEEKQVLLLENEKLLEDNQHNRKVIEGLVDNISLADMRQRITQIIQKGGISDIRDKWHMLYLEFDKKYHINVSTRMNNSVFSGSKMDFIEEELDMIPELYDLTCKLFESSYNALVESWGKFAKRANRYKL